MAIWCVGSINIDHFYAVTHIVAPGETLAATGIRSGLGGKGANQSVAAARAGSKVHHIGATGADGAWVVERLESYGVDISRVDQTKPKTAHAIIAVADDGENAIIIYSAANRSLDEASVATFLGEASEGDILLLQNETNAQVEAAKAAKARGVRVFYSAAPFDVAAVDAVAPYIDLLIMNEIEEQQLMANLPDLTVPERLVTLGADGARWASADGSEASVSAPKVTAVDTTGAGDTFAGYFAAGIDQGMSVEEAMRLATSAAALKVTRPGTADAIPGVEEVLQAYD